MSDDRIADIRKRHEYDVMPSAGCAGAWRWLDPLVGRTAHNDRATLLAEVDRLRAENDQLTRERDEARAEVERMREAIRTIRARCVELDDSDAVSATFDISNAVLEDEP